MPRHSIESLDEKVRDVSEFQHEFIGKLSGITSLNDAV